MPIQSFDQPEMLHPGEVVPLDIAIMLASEVFDAGEQLRITIAGHELTAPPAKAPSWPPGVPAPAAAIADQQLRRPCHSRGGDHQSFLQIPVIPVMDEFAAGFGFYNSSTKSENYTMTACSSTLGKRSIMCLLPYTDHRHCIISRQQARRDSRTARSSTGSPLATFRDTEMAATIRPDLSRNGAAMQRRFSATSSSSIA